jgi:hypothetical protein
MKLKSILLEKLPGGVKAKMLSLERSRNTQWKFTLRLIDPIMKDVSLKWGYVTTALDSEDFDRKKVSAIYSEFKEEVLDNADKWAFVTKKAPKKRTYGVRQVIEVEVDAIPKNTEQLQEPIDPKDPKTEKVVLNTKKMKLMDKVRGIELYEKPYKYPYEAIKPEKINTAGGTETGGTETGGTETGGTETILYDPAKANVEDDNVRQFQQLIVNKLGSMMKGVVPEYDAFLRVGGADGKFGNATKNLIDFLEEHYGISRTNGTKITPELQQKIEAGA